MQALLELLHQCLPQHPPLPMCLHRQRSVETFLAPSSHLVSQQQALDGSVDGLGVGLSTHLECVLVWRQQLFTCLFQQRAALHREEGGEIWHLVAAYLCPRGTRSEPEGEGPWAEQSWGVCPLCASPDAFRALLECGGDVQGVQKHPAA